MNKIEKIFRVLLDAFGKQNWWPAKSFDEMVIGAMLVQNTNWKNVEKSIRRLKAEKICSLKSLKTIDEVTLADIIRPSGFNNVKANRLINIAKRIPEISKDSMLVNLRNELLQIKGIGKETADSIILYRYKKPLFVVDNYTRRIFSRLGLISGEINYDQIQKIFHDNLDCNVYVYNEYHALIVKLGKDHCKKQPVCIECPLKSYCNLYKEKALAEEGINY